MLIIFAQQIRRTLFLFILSTMLLSSFETIAKERTLLFSGGPDGVHFNISRKGSLSIFQKNWMVTSS